ncbi:MAG: cation:proton antiporter [Solirubrobacterales bacterium]
MGEWAVAFIAVSVLAWALIERRLATTAITGPMVFIAVGLAAGSDGLGIIELDSDRARSVIDVVLEATLVLVLFTGAARLHPSSWRKDAALPGRLLGIGLPLTIAVGWLLAVLLFTDLGVWEAAIIGAIIAPTDAALGEAVTSNPGVPARIRSALDVESGLNDGVSLPFVLVFIALAEGSLGDNQILETFVQAIGVAVVVGAAAGLIGGRLLVGASGRKWTSRGWSGVAVIAVAATAFTVADQLGGSGFIACFVGGLTYGEVTKRHLEGSNRLASDLGGALIQVSFLLIGAIALGPALGALTWQIVLMAVLALTIARIVPVAISMAGVGLRPPTIAYLGWFGPRGLATVVFAILVVEEADLPGSDLIVTVATITVALSAYAHGLTANWGANRYARWYAGKEKDSVAPEAKPLAHSPAPRAAAESAPATGG